MLNSVRKFFNRDDGEKSERYIVCGFVKWTYLVWNFGLSCERVNVRIGVSHTLLTNFLVLRTRPAGSALLLKHGIPLRDEQNTPEGSKPKHLMPFARRNLM
jgi:hypothetical protein